LRLYLTKNPKDEKENNSKTNNDGDLYRITAIDFNRTTDK
jgi:hypothetical protein